MSLLVAYRDAVIDTIRRTMPELRRVEKKNGPFTVKELNRYVADAPCVYVSVISAKHGNNYSTGQLSAHAQVLCAIITRNVGQIDADDAGKAIAENIFTLASFNFFGAVGYTPTELVIQQIDAIEADKAGVAIHAVGWYTEIVLGKDFLATDLEIDTDTYVFPPMGLDSPGVKITEGTTQYLSTITVDNTIPVDPKYGDGQAPNHG